MLRKLRLLPCIALFAGLCLDTVQAMTVDEYTRLTEPERLAYTSGLIDGLSVLAAGQPALMACIERSTYREFNRQYDERVAAEPARWRMNGGGMMALMLRDICPL